MRVPLGVFLVSIVKPERSGHLLLANGRWLYLEPPVVN